MDRRGLATGISLGLAGIVGLVLVGRYSPDTFKLGGVVLNRDYYDAARVVLYLDCGVALVLMIGASQARPATPLLTAGVLLFLGTTGVGGGLAVRLSRDNRAATDAATTTDAAPVPATTTDAAPTTTELPALPAPTTSRRAAVTINCDLDAAGIPTNSCSDDQGQPSPPPGQDPAVGTCRDLGRNAGGVVEVYRCRSLP